MCVYVCDADLLNPLSTLSRRATHSFTRSFPNAASDELDDLHCELLNSKNEQESFKPDVKKKVVSALVPHLQKVLGDLLLEIKKK